MSLGRTATLLAAVAVASATAGLLLLRNTAAPQVVLADGAPIVQVQVPTLSGDAVIGALGFQAKCAACHGENASGIEGKAPPLVHKIYEPSHHGDQAFFMAAQNGVRAHHWPFGNMPPVEGVTRADVVAILAYVRALQQANGIF
ncbi:MAG: cytochrome c [Paracoccaceae bacterium]|nr:cytochrome c [Paracoccaceae bacterium]